MCVRDAKGNLNLDHPVQKAISRISPPQLRFSDLLNYIDVGGFGKAGENSNKMLHVNQCVPGLIGYKFPTPTHASSIAQINFDVVHRTQNSKLKG